MLSHTFGIDTVPAIYAGTRTTDDEDRRVEVAAARETALVQAIAISRFDQSAQDVAFVAASFETFLLDHPTNGEEALVQAMAFCEKLSWRDLPARLDVAAVFAAYLENGHTPAPNTALSDVG